MAILAAAAVVFLKSAAPRAFLGGASPAAAAAPARVGVARAAMAQDLAPFTVNVDVQAPDGQHPFAADSAKPSVREAFAATLAPFDDLVERVDVGLRAETPLPAEGPAAHGYDVSVTLRDQEEPAIVVSGRRRAEAATALAAQGSGFLGRVLRSVEREVKEERERDLFRRRRSEEVGDAAAAADDVADAVAAFSDDLAEAEVRAAEAEAEGERLQEAAAGLRQGEAAAAL